MTLDVNAVAEQLGADRVHPVEHLDCGCIVAVDTRVVVFAPHSCRSHHAGRAVAEDPRFAEWTEHGDPVA